MSTITELTPVTSSNIKAIGHDPSQYVMVVEFMHGGRYSYQNVDKALYDSILNADSVGSAFSKKVKAHPGLYPFAKE